MNINERLQEIKRKRLYEHFSNNHYFISVEDIEWMHDTIKQLQEENEIELQQQLYIVELEKELQSKKDWGCGLVEDKFNLEERIAELEKKLNSLSPYEQWKVDWNPNKEGE